MVQEVNLLLCKLEARDQTHNTPQRPAVAAGTHGPGAGRRRQQAPEAWLASQTNQNGKLQVQ